MIIVKIVLILLLLILLLRLKIPFIISILFTALILGVGFNLSFQMMAKTVWATVKDRATLDLMAIVGLVLIFSELLRSSGYLSQLSQVITQLFGIHRLTLATMPALIGLLPMPGGALFSAPLVETVTADAGGMAPYKKTLFNYWFRHLWEYSWPLYPGIILAASFVEMPLSTLCFFQLPLTLVAIGVGILFIFPTINLSPSLKPTTEIGSNIQEEHKTAQPSRFRNFFKMLYLLSPILLIIALFLLINISLLWALLIGCGWAILMSLHSKRLTWLSTLRIIFTRPAVYHMILIVLSVLIFVHIMQQSTLSAGLTRFFCHYQTKGGGITNILAIIFLPFIVALLTGLTIAYVGISIPIVLNVFIPPGMAHNPLPYIMLCYAAGFAGVMLSPSHLCLILTNKYFGSSLGQVYRRLIPIVLTAFGLALGLFFLYTM